MVFYFTTSSGLLVYMGADKYENEELIKYGWPEDIWFHVSKLSSAHVYVRLPRGPLRKAFRETGTLDHLPELDLAELCALTKANSIEGCKKASVTVVYTAWENLHKRADMDTGTIGFRDNSAVIKVRCARPHLAGSSVDANIHESSCCCSQRIDQGSECWKTEGAR